MKNGDWRINRSPSMLPSARKAKHQALRAEIFQLLGGICCKCGFSDERALQIDHVEGGGCQEIKVKKGTSYLYHVRKHIDTGRYQLLCANCNWIKRHENGEVKDKYAPDHEFPKG